MAVQMGSARAAQMGDEITITGEVFAILDDGIVLMNADSQQWYVELMNDPVNNPVRECDLAEIAEMAKHDSGS
jgi:hypothetical protein